MGFPLNNIMFRIWCKLVKNNKITNDEVVIIQENNSSREEKINFAIDEVCLKFDIQRPMWFDKNTKDMLIFSKTDFRSDQFIETVDFDYFEIEIIEEDDLIS